MFKIMGWIFEDLGHVPMMLNFTIIFETFFEGKGIC